MTLGLWAWALVGVVAPLGAALAHLALAREPAAAQVNCPLPPVALASREAASRAAPCR